MTEKLSLKTSLLPLSTLETDDLSLDEIAEKLAKKRAAAPGLFSRFPCILSLPSRADTDYTLKALISTCEEQGILLIGVSGATAGWVDDIHTLRLAEFSAAKELPTSEADSEDSGRQLKIHQGNVRSGQTVYSKGDLIVLGNISPGADVVAGRDIHIHGHAQGRLFAGAPDNEEAIITGQNLNPEVISIAGNYHIDENRSQIISDKFTIVQLDDHSITYTTSQ